LERRNLHKRLTNLADGTIYLALAKEFYANLYNSKDPSPKQARVRGHLVKIDIDSLNTFLETLVVLEEGETLPTYSRYCRLPLDYREIEAALCIPGIAGCPYQVDLCPGLSHGYEHRCSHIRLDDLHCPV